MKAKSVLLVDHNPTDRKVIQQLCLQSGVLNITTAESGTAALAMLSQQSNPFDLLICELDLPGLDGIELIRTLAADQINIALIIVSSKAAVLLNAVEQMARANGMQVLAALTKPVQPDQLLAALQQKLWAESGFSTTVSVNLSATSFNSAAFGQQMIQLLSAADIDISTLVFEVTESAVIQSTATALYILSRFRLLGAGLSIDNYGTGYSTIKHLSQYPYSELKVDRSLIRHIAAQPHMQVIFESILQMCKRLQIQLVAEGVETQADWDYLQQSGCPVAQGYLIAPPMPAQQLQSWWQQGKHNGRNPISF